MNNKIFKYIKYLSYVMLGLGVVVFAYFLVASLTQTQPSSEPGFAAWSAGSVSGINVMLIYAYILLAVTILVALIFPLINIVKNPKGSMRSLIGLLAMVVVLGIGYIFSKSTPIITPVDTYDNVFELRLTDTGLIAAYIIFFVAIATILFGEIKSALKK